MLIAKLLIPYRYRMAMTKAEIHRELYGIPGVTDMLVNILSMTPDHVRDKLVQKTKYRFMVEAGLLVPRNDEKIEPQEKIIEDGSGQYCFNLSEFADGRKE